MGAGLAASCSPFMAALGVINKSEIAMKILRYSLVLSTVLIYLFTVIAIKGYGLNWPAIAIGDLVSLNWRSQFDVDFLIHLLLLATWVVWREGATARAYMFGFLTVVLGGMFSFPYILYISIKAKGKVKTMLMGVNAERLM